MSSRTESSDKPFYVYSVDLAKGIVLIPMIFGHALLWYDRTRAYAWDKGSELFLLFSNSGENTLAMFWLITIAFMVFPCFFYVYGFNAANSLIRQGPGANRAAIRSRSLRRVIILFIVGSFGQSIMALVVSPGEVINYILTWNFFHLFGFTTLSFLVIFEIVWWLEKRGYNPQQLLVSIIAGVLAILLIIFVIFHDYWDPATAQHIILSTKIEIVDILKHALIDYGTTPIIPFFAFGLMGGLAATALNLPDPESSKSASHKAIIFLIIGVVFYLVGAFFSLFIERSIATPVEYPASTTFIFFTLGVLNIFIMSLLIIFDFDHISFNYRDQLKQLLKPLAIFGQLSLTIYFIHNIMFGIPVEMMFFYQKDLLFFIFMVFYTILFIIIAVVWRKKLKFKYTFEWAIRKFTSE